MEEENMSNGSKPKVADHVETGTGSNPTTNPTGTATASHVMSRGIVVEASISEKRALDGRKHTAARLLPMIMHDGNATTFLTSIESFLTLCRAISAGAPILLQNKAGEEKKVFPKETPIEGRRVIPTTSLPATLADIVDLIHAGFSATHRNQIGAWLTASFEKEAGAKRATNSDVGLDVE